MIDIAPKQALLAHTAMSASGNPLIGSQPAASALCTRMGQFHDQNASKLKLEGAHCGVDASMSTNNCGSITYMRYHFPSWIGAANIPPAQP
jgi:hypothetical protein